MAQPPVARGSGVAAPRRSPEEIEAWLRAALAERVRMPPESVNLDATFRLYGIDSIELPTIAGELEEWLGVKLEMELFARSATIRELIQRLAELNPRSDVHG